MSWISRKPIWILSIERLFFVNSEVIYLGLYKNNDRLLKCNLSIENIVIFLGINIPDKSVVGATGDIMIWNVFVVGAKWLDHQGW